MTVKQQLRDLAERLPDNVTWDDVLYEIYVQRRLRQELMTCGPDGSSPSSRFAGGTAWASEN